MAVLDSSYLVAFHNDRDVHHEAAARAMPALLAGERGQLLLLEYVFLEVVTVVLLRRDLETASRVGDALLAAREVEFVPCSDVFVDAWDTFADQATGTVSFAGRRYRHRRSAR